MPNEKQVNARLQQKHDLEINWRKAINFSPLPGEIVVYDAETTAPTIEEAAILHRDYAVKHIRIKIGDSAGTKINALPFAGATLFVTYDEEGLSSHSPAEICFAVNSGVNVFFSVDGSLFPIAQAQNDYVVFSIIDYSGGYQGYAIDESRIISPYTDTFLFNSAYEPLIVEITQSTEQALAGEFTVVTDITPEEIMSIVSQGSRNVFMDFKGALLTLDWVNSLSAAFTTGMNKGPLQDVFTIDANGNGTVHRFRLASRDEVQSKTQVQIVTWEEDD